MSFSKPTDKQVADALPLLISPQHEEHFFGGLQNPYWIEPLVRLKMFANPPGPQTVPSGGIRYPNWPLSQYLARMASTAPKEVVGVFKTIKTSNIRIVWDMVRAAQAMSVEHQVSMVPLLVEAAKNGSLWMAFDAASELCISLAKAKQVKEAMHLAEAMFAPSSANDHKFPNQNAEYEYKEALGPVSLALTEADPKGMLGKLRDWLSRVLHHQYTIDREKHDDFSAMWRPAIEDHEENHDHDLNGEVVDVMRDCLEEAIRNGWLPLEACLSIVDTDPLTIFKRLRLHLLAEFGDRSPALAKASMLDETLFMDWRLKHEYAMLMGKRFPLLDERERHTWFGFLDKQEDMAWRVESWTERTGAPPSRAEIQRWHDYWKFERLHWIRAHLEGAKKTFYDTMLAESGEPELADLNSRVSTRWGSESPIPASDFENKPFAEVAERVTNWRAPEGGSFFDPDQDGLASVFEQYVGTDPTKHSNDAGLLGNAPPIFIVRFLGRMSGAIREGRAVDVDAVIGLCEAVVDHPIKQEDHVEPQRTRRTDKETWAWARTEATRFIEAVCTSRTNGNVTYALANRQERLWAMLAKLSGDETRSNVIRDTSSQDPRLHDYLDLGINSPRGRVVEAALEYARWIGHDGKKVDGHREVFPGGLGAIREVRDLLEREIVPGQRSIEVMAVIGSRLNLLFWLDKEWVVTHIPQLFDLESIGRTPIDRTGWAAWNAFLVWVLPHVEYYRAFQSRFAFAVDQACRLNGEVEETRAAPMHHLAEHLMLLYIRGQLGFDEDGGLLRRFVLNAAADIRRYAISFVGRVLSNKEKLPAEVVQRCRELWALYWEGPGKDDLKNAPQAIVFGEWFASGRFESAWALAQLDEITKVVGLAEPDHEVAKELDRIAESDMAASLRILERMIQGDKDGWRVQGFIKAATRILNKARSMGDPHAATARQITSMLGHRGYTVLPASTDESDDD